MTIDKIEIYNTNGKIYDSAWTPLNTLGSYGQELRADITITKSVDITGNITFDAEMFGLLAFDDGNFAPPHNEKMAKAFVYNYDLLSPSVETPMYLNGNDATNIIGSATIEKITQQKCIIRHTFVLCEDLGTWMHKALLTTLDNSLAYDTTGDNHAYDQIKYYNVYVWNDEFAYNGIQAQFNEYETLYLGPAYFDNISLEIYNPTLNTELLSGINNTVRVLFTDTNSDIQRVDLMLIQNEQFNSELPREQNYRIAKYTTTTITVVSGSDKYAELTVLPTDLNIGYTYKLIPVLIGSGGKTTSKKDTIQLAKKFTECLPKIEPYFLSYLNTKQTPKIDIAPYERMMLEIHVWHDTYPTETPPSPSYLNCLTSQSLFVPNFESAFKRMDIEWFDGSIYSWINQSGTITAINGEYEEQTISGHKKSIFKVPFRANELYINQLWELDAVFQMGYNQFYAVGNTIQQIEVVQHTIIQPLNIRIANYQNGLITPDITSMTLFDSDGNEITTKICDESEYCKVESESATNYQAQALLINGNAVIEEENFASVQTNAYFAQKSTTSIFDLDDDFTLGDNEFKVQINLQQNKILVIGCQA